MDKLNNCIDYCNHLTTLTLSDEISLKHQINPLIKEPDFENCFSLKEVLNKIGEVYCNFKKDYEELPRLNLGESFEFWDYYENNDYIEVTLLINNPKKELVSNDTAYLDIVKRGEVIDSYVTTDDHEYYSPESGFSVTIDKDSANKYIEFIKNFFNFIDFYSISNRSFLFLNNSGAIEISYTGNIYDTLKSIILNIEMEYENTEIDASIVYDLSILNIDYDNSKVKINKCNNIDKKEIINNILEKIYLNKTRLAPVYYGTQNDKTLRLKKD